MSLNVSVVCKPKYLNLSIYRGKLMWGEADTVPQYPNQRSTVTRQAGTLYIMVGSIFMVLSDAENWTEAQRYCREKYTDLVTINSEEVMIRLSHILSGSEDEVWIGLYGDFNNWKWSLDRKGFYREGEAELRLWAAWEPNAFHGKFMCADIGTDGRWSDYWCDSERTFVCYNEFSKTRFIYVKTLMTWTDAQRYCRANYTDLASVRNSTENEEIRRLVDNYAWIGLYRESWKWSDGQRMQMTSFSSWNWGQPDKIIDSCVTTTHSKWNARLCNNTYAFVCSEYAVLKRTVKVILRKSDPSVDLEEMQDSILQQFNQRLKDHGLGQQVKLRWLVQPDGKIFHSTEAEEEKEKKKC
ncbi:secretory phospholipase A2 receptor-like isoform X2 [Thunnus albacares]|uniref:secretory phospholipase A2 receptor-like isoform X2 n=1 Tax=Thunnus albacares TaxID=8236 RepID=UPI001CF715E0|nr:secretory phospholipase A2 receptor-like isoform X2 [Thunnus albacares]